MIAGTLEVQLLANLARLQQDMNQAKGMVANATRDIERMASQMRAALGAIGVGIGIGGLIAMFKSVTDAGDEAVKSAQKAGVGIEAWQKYAYAAKLAGVSSEQLGKGLKGLGDFANQVTINSAESVDMFKRLGVSVRDAGGNMKPTEALLLDMADRFANMPDGLEKTTAATKVFGKAGMDLIPFLNQGREGIEALLVEAERLGIVMDGPTALAAEALNDNMTRLSTSMRGMAVRAISPLIPFLNQMAEGWAKGQVEGEGFRGTSEKITTGLRLLVSAALTTVASFEAIGNALGGIAAAAQALVSGEWGRIGTIFAAVKSDNATVLEKLGNDLGALWNTVQADAPKVRKTMTELGATTIKAAEATRRLTDEEKLALAEAKRLNAEVEKTIKFEEQLLAAREGAIRSFREGVEQMEFEVTLLGKSNAEREVAIRLRALEKAGIDATNPSLKAYVDRIKAAVEAQETFHGQQEMLRDQASVWNQISDVAGSFFSDLVMNGKSAFDNLKRWAKDLLAQMIALFAKRWVLNLAAGGSMLGAAGSAFAGGVGDGSMAGGLIGAASSLLPGGAVGTAFGNIANMGASLLGASGSLASAIGSFASFIPVIGTAIAVVTMLATIFGDKGENPNFRWMQGTGGQGAFGGVSTQGNYDFQGSALLAYIGSLDARFVRLLGEEGSARASANLSAYTGAGLRTDGQPAQFAFPEGDDTAPEQIAKELLQSRYGILFDEIDAQIAEQVRNWEGDSTSLQQFIETMLGVVEGLGQLNLLGLNVESLRAMQREGESLDQAFLRVANTWAWFTDNFYTDAEKLEMAEADVNEVFAALGLAVPDSITAFRQLVESIDLSTDAGRAMWDMLMGVAPAFLMVANATGTAADTITESAQQITEAQRAMNEELGYSGIPLAERERRERQKFVDAQAGLQGYLGGLLLNTSVSPLTLQQRFMEAQGQYQGLLGKARGGDLEAIQGLSGASDAYLQLARQLFGSSGDYNSIFTTVFDEIRGVAGGGPTWQSSLQSALPASGTLATSADLAEIAKLLTHIARGQYEAADQIAERIAESGDKTVAAVETSGGGGVL